MKILKRILISLCVLGLGLFAYLMIDAYVELRKPGLIVLLYHEVVKKDTVENKYQIKVEEFQKHLNYLTRAGYQTVLPQEMRGIDTQNDYSKMVVLTFDDGNASDYNTVFPILKQRNMKAVFFVVAKHINSPWSLTEAQILDMSRNKMEIGSHSYSHSILDVANDNFIYEELKKSKDYLSNVMNKEAISFAPPGGWFDDRVVRIAKNVGYKYFFGCEIGANNLEEMPFVYKRIEILGDMSDDDFQDVLNPPKIMWYKVTQSLKFIFRDMIGSKNYSKLSEVI